MSAQSKEWLEEYRRNAVAIMAAKDAEIERLQSKLSAALLEIEEWKQLEEYRNAEIAGIREAHGNDLIRLHRLSEDHSHCEDLLHELGARASSAESRLDASQKMVETWHVRAEAHRTGRDSLYKAFCEMEKERDSALRRLEQALADKKTNGDVAHRACDYGMDVAGLLTKGTEIVNAALRRQSAALDTQDATAWLEECASLVERQNTK